MAILVVALIVSAIDHLIYFWTKTPKDQLFKRVQFWALMAFSVVIGKDALGFRLFQEDQEGRMVFDVGFLPSSADVSSGWMYFGMLLLCLYLCARDIRKID